MTNLETLYNRIESDYYGMRNEWREYSFEELMKDVEDITKYKSIFNYIMRYKPFTEEQAEHFLKMDNAFMFICKRYNPLECEMHEEYQTVIEDIYDNKITDIKDTPCFAELRWRVHKLWEQFQNLTLVYVDEKDVSAVADGINDRDFVLNEYDSKVLLQFKNPLLVLASEIGKFDEPFNKCVERAIENLNNVDLLTYKYDLEKDRILPETKHRHNAINKLMDLIPDFYFSTAREWLKLNMQLNEGMLLDDSGEDPYREFLDTMLGIKNEHGTELLQKVFDMGEEIVMQPIELVEVAKYLADGGDVDRVSELVDDDFFLIPYEEQKQGGMNLC